MQKGENPSPDAKYMSAKNRRTSFSDDLKAATIDSTSHSPLRRLSALPTKISTGKDFADLGPSVFSQSSQKNLHEQKYKPNSILDIKNLQKAPSLYGGGFESIINKVSDTYKIQDILPKTSSTNYLIKQELSISPGDPYVLDSLGRHNTDKSVDDRKRNILKDRKKSTAEVDCLMESFSSRGKNGWGATVESDPLISSLASGITRRKSAIGKNIGQEPISIQESDRGLFGTILIDDDYIPENAEIFSKSENEGSRMLQKLLTFDKRPLIHTEDDTESVKSYNSSHSGHELEYSDHLLMENFTGQLLKKRSTISGTTVSKIKSLATSSNETQQLGVSGGDPNQLGLPQSELIYKRRASFASTLLNALPVQIEDLTQSSKPRQKIVVPTPITKPAIKHDFDQTSKNLTPKIGIDHSYTPKVKEHKVVIDHDKTTKAIESWKKLRDDSKGVQNDPPPPVKFIGLEEVVSVVKDLQSLGMDTKVMKEVDKTTLKSVIGVKKWVSSSKQKKMNENAALRKFIKSIDHRLVNEIPKPLCSNLVTGMIPVLLNLKKEYASQLGDNHEYVDRLDSFIESLSIKSEFKKRKSITNEKQTWWTLLFKRFQSQKRVSPMIQKPDTDDSKDYLLHISMKVEDKV